MEGAAGSRRFFLLIDQERQERTVAASIIPSPSVAPGPVPSVEVPQLSAYLREVPDHRQAQGRRYSLASILLLLVAGTLAGRQHRRGVFEWGRLADPAIQAALGFTRGQTPAASTLHEVLVGLDWEAFATQLRQWALAVLQTVDPTGAAAWSCDGKTVRASLREGASVAHLLSVFVPEWGVTLDLEPVARKSGELAAAPGLFLRLPVAGRTVLLDALFTHEPLAVALVQAGADYVLPVKRNQPELHTALEELFHARVPPAWRLEEFDEWGQGHGRRERRPLILVAPPLGERLDWGRSQQYFRLVRERWRADQPLIEAPQRSVVYGITSLSRERADAATIAKLVRGHWQIENGSHWVRDTLCREDESRSVKPTIVQVLTGVRCAAVTLLHGERRRRGKSLASLQRRLEQKPHEILQLTGTLG